MYAKKGAGYHLACPGLVNAINKGKVLVGYLGRWLDSIGAVVTNLESPDVQEKAGQGPPHARNIVAGVSGGLELRQKCSPCGYKRTCRRTPSLPAHARFAGSAVGTQVREGAVFCQDSVEAAASRLRRGQHPVTGESL